VESPGTRDEVLPQLRARRSLRGGPCTFATLVSLLLAGASGQARAEEAREQVRYAVGAALSRTRGSVRFDERIEVDAALLDAARTLTLWLYADRAREVPPSYDEFTVDRLFPTGLSRGGFGDLTVEVEGCAVQRVAAATHADPVRGRDVPIAVCPAATSPLHVRVTGSLDAPHRYGTLGHAAGALMLGDPWYPLVVTPGAQAPPQTTHALRVTWDDGTLVDAAGVFTGGEASWTQQRATHAPLFLLSEPAVTKDAAGGVVVTLVTDRPPRAGDAPPSPEGWQQSDPWDPDATSLVASAVRSCIRFLRRLDFLGGDAPAPRTMPRSLVVAMIPERQRLAVALPGMVVVSDHAFLLLPLERVRRFHALAIERRVFDALVAPHVTATGGALDTQLAGDMDGVQLVDMMVASEREHRDRPKDLLGFFGFHPAVDTLLYAPHIAFHSAYFHDIDEDDPDRDGAQRARNALPFGELVLEKLHDRLGDEGFARAALAHFERGVDWKQAAEDAHGAPLDEFWRTWLGGRRRLAYGIAGRADAPLGGGRWRHLVTLERRGDTWVREPVVLEMSDTSGERARRVWDAAGARGEVTWDSGAPLDRAELDPDGRLVEDQSLEDNHVRFDDETAHTWRPPVFNGFALTASVTEARLDASVNFIVKRLYDVREAWGFVAASTAVGQSGSVRYYRGVGPLRDPNSTQGTWSFGAAGLRSNSGFGGSPVPVTQGSVALGYAWEERKWLVDPRTGWGASAVLGGGIARQDDGAQYPTVGVSARAGKLWWVHPRHVLAALAGGGATYCPAVPQQLESLSGRQLLRGYAADELLGCAAAYAILEDRITVLRGVYWDAAQLAWFKGLELVPFVAGGFLSSRTTAADLLEHPYGEVGAGLRAFFDYGGVQPGVVSVDAALPLSRASTTYVDATGVTRTRPPFGLYVSFEQTY
jgi:hypothetical protein